MTRAESEELLEIVVKTQNRLRGRLAGLCESWGLDQHRTTAMIQTMKGISYDNEQELKQALYRLSLE